MKNFKKIAFVMLITASWLCTGSQVTSYVWDTLQFSTKLPDPYKVARLSAEINENYFTLLTLSIGNEGKTYIVPSEVLKEIKLPQLHTFQLFHSTLPTDHERWYVELDFKYGDPVFGVCKDGEENNEHPRYSTINMYFYSNNKIAYDRYDICGEILEK